MDDFLKMRDEQYVKSPNSTNFRGQLVNTKQALPNQLFNLTPPQLLEESISFSATDDDGFTGAILNPTN